MSKVDLHLPSHIPSTLRTPRSAKRLGNSLKGSHKQAPHESPGHGPWERLTSRQGLKVLAALHGYCKKLHHPSFLA